MVRNKVINHNMDIRILFFRLTGRCKVLRNIFLLSLLLAHNPLTCIRSNIGEFISVYIEYVEKWEKDRCINIY